MPPRPPNKGGLCAAGRQKHISESPRPSGKVPAAAHRFLRRLGPGRVAAGGRAVASASAPRPALPPSPGEKLQRREKPQTSSEGCKSSIKSTECRDCMQRKSAFQGRVAKENAGSLGLLSPRKGSDALPTQGARGVLPPAPGPSYPMALRSEGVCTPKTPQCLAHLRHGAWSCCIRESAY